MELFINSWAAYGWKLVFYIENQNYCIFEKYIITPALLRSINSLRRHHTPGPFYFRKERIVEFISGPRLRLSWTTRMWTGFSSWPLKGVLPTSAGKRGPRRP
jgi:hypothetical protein